MGKLHYMTAKLANGESVRTYYQGSRITLVRVYGESGQVAGYIAPVIGGWVAVVGDEEPHFESTITEATMWVVKYAE